MWETYLHFSLSLILLYCNPDTLHVRIAGVTAPVKRSWHEAGQPNAKEAQKWLEGQILGQTIWCQVATKDRHHRIVSDYISITLLLGV
jgi:endonuclease YncB( thermonuclease family)